VRRILVTLPNLAGHRQVYCRELCEYLLCRGFFVTVATDLTGLDEYAQLATLRENPNVQFVSDTWANEPHASTQLRELGNAVRVCGADVTLLLEADDAHALLAAQIGRPMHGLPCRRVGLFIRSTNYVHDVACTPTGRIGRAVLAALAYPYRPVSLQQPRIFHEVVMRHFAVLDVALCLDEVFVAMHGVRYGWLPDIAVVSDEGGETSAESVAWASRVSAFLNAQRGRPVVAYTGPPQARRGYDVLLQLACDIGGCFLHCGRTHGYDGYPVTELPAKAELASRSAILESGSFYQDFQTARITLSAARCVVLPYDRLHRGSSGAMLQALMAGLPVLVPDQGLMAWRVRTFGLGLTFAPGDWRDMGYKFRILQNTPPEFFADSIGRYLAYFSRTQFEAAMDGALGLRRAAALVPALDGIGSTHQAAPRL
jgi:glycosyltransferase involved in cell wall biosynthesis